MFSIDFFFSLWAKYIYKKKQKNGEKNKHLIRSSFYLFIYFRSTFATMAMLQLSVFTKCPRATYM